MSAREELRQIKVRHEYMESSKDTPRGMTLAYPVVASLHADRAALLDALEAAEAALEKARIQLAACGVIAMSNTPDSAKHARAMLPDYDCASIHDVSAAVDREMTAREKLAATEARERRLREAAIELANEHRKKFRSDAVLLRRIDAALAETAP